MAKCCDHYTKFKTVYFTSTKDKALTTQIKCVQNFDMPLGLHLLYLRAGGGGDVFADSCRDYCKMPANIQQFTRPNPPEHNGLSERDGYTITEVVGCMSNRAAPPKFLRGKMLPITMFILNRGPGKTISGDTSYNRMFSKHTEMFFL